MWLHDDGSIWTETCCSRFYNFNYFNNLRILQFVCISWKIKCLIYFRYGATMKSVRSMLHVVYFSNDFRFARGENLIVFKDIMEFVRRCQTFWRNCCQNFRPWILILQFLSKTEHGIIKISLTSPSIDL